MDMRYVMLMLLAIPLASAVPQGIGALKGEGLDAAMTNVECKTDFMVGVIYSMNEKLGVNDDLNAQADILQGDVGKLNGYADSNDTASFRDYVHGTFAQHMRDAKSAIKDARKGLAANTSVCNHGKGKKATENVTAEDNSTADENCTSMGQIRKELSDIYKEMRATYDSCHFGSLKHAADTKVEEYQEKLQNKRDKIEDLGAKGVDTAELEGVVDEAEDEIVNPLEDAVDAAENDTELKDAMHGYCLHDGCKDGKNFHLGARFETAKLGAILDKIRDAAEAKGLGEEVAAIGSALDSAQEILDAAGDSQLSASDEESLDGYVDDAAARLKALLSKLRSDS